MIFMSTQSIASIKRNTVRIRLVECSSNLSQAMQACLESGYRAFYEILKEVAGKQHLNVACIYICMNINLLRISKPVNTLRISEFLPR